MDVILNFIYDIKLVPPQDLIFKVPKTINANSLQFLHVRRCLKSEWCQLKGDGKASSSSPKEDHALYKHLRSCTNSLEVYGKRACIHEFRNTL